LQILLRLQQFWASVHVLPLPVRIDDQYLPPKPQNPNKMK
jgi:hypothetical protein